MDFYKIQQKYPKEGPPQIYPDWIIGRSQDLMVRGQSFYAIWDEKTKLWSKDEYDVQRLVDEQLHKHNEENNGMFQVQNLRSFNTQIWATFRKFLRHVSDSYHPLDETLVFANTELTKSTYASRYLPYALEPGSHDAWDELLSVLYAPEERDKIEWAIGAVVSGDSKKIQKFLVFYGPAGSGKSTVLNIIQKLFEGYTVMFDAKALGTSNNAFSTEAFRDNPLVAIQHDGDLSRIDDNTKLNSIISHEDMMMNEKYKPSYSSRINAFLFMGTNQPVKISDAKSGIIRRLIDVHPTGVMFDESRYWALMERVEFELGAIAHHCLKRYQEMGKTYYNSYRPLEMMLQTDVFYNYVEWCFDIFKAQNGVSLKQAYELYKEFCLETGIDKLLPRHKFRDELRNYFDEFQDRAEVDGVMVSSYYSGFKKLTAPDPYKPDVTYQIVLDDIESAFDHIYPDQPAQYGKDDGTPAEGWAYVNTTLKNIDTRELHWVQVPTQHIVIDFDLVNEEGNKDQAMNLAEASKWPPTYTELSQSGSGVHLHYIYTGDVTRLSQIYDVGVEVKTLLGGQALRRRLTKCNNLEIATITSGLPEKEPKPMMDNKSIRSEKGLRDLIEKNLRKEVHPGTKPSIDFIKHILDEAYESGMGYDVSDMRGRITTFALMSSNQSETCLKTVQKMQFVGQGELPEVKDVTDNPLVFFDVEVYPNLFVVCWKYQGSSEVVKMVNPEAPDIESLFKLKLVGFNNRRFDNHVLYARFLGYSIEELYKLVDKIINVKDSNPLFREAYNLSYTDIYDFSSLKKSLKWFEIELGIHHMELDLPWDQPVDEKLWQKVIDYCVNDVIATEIVFESRKQDFVARQILSELSGLSVNHTTQVQTAKIIFGDEKNPQKDFIYTDLSKEFPGYVFEFGKSTYRGEDPSEGGYVYAEPGIHNQVVVLDVASMHPTSIEVLRAFGPYTERYSELKEARMAIKRKDYDVARNLLGGKLAQFIDGGESDADALSYALKIVINTVYGLTSARFPNPFKDNRNVDNIVAKRGALFMIDLKHAVQEQGFTVAHIKTDSIKIPNATQEIIEFVTEFGKSYGYDFEHETTYDKFCLVNDAVYIARSGDKWTAVGAQFQHPYVFKTLFSGEELTFDDYCETKSVTQGNMYLDENLYLDFNEGDPDVPQEKPLIHVGRCGSFVPVTRDGGLLWRVKDGKRYAVAGTKGFRWIERERAIFREDEGLSCYDFIDMSYFHKLTTEAKAAIEKYGSFDEFMRG